MAELDRLIELEGGWKELPQPSAPHQQAKPRRRIITEPWEHRRRDYVEAKVRAKENDADMVTA